MSEIPPMWQETPQRAANTMRNCLIIGCGLSVMVCLGVMGLTLTSLRPMFQRGTEIRRGRICLSNLRDIANAMKQYQLDHQERVAPASLWMDVVRPYVKSNRADVLKNDFVFRCPDARAQNEDHYGYAMNSKLSRIKLSMLDPLDLSDTPFIYDSVNVAQRSASDPASSLPDPGRHERRDKKMNMILFADGRVEAIERDRSKRGEEGKSKETR